MQLCLYILNGIWTRIVTVKEWCPNQLDDENYKIFFTCLLLYRCKIYVIEIKTRKLLFNKFVN